jgi:uncharacterized CHY-type Zn-finger protein
MGGLAELPENTHQRSTPFAKFIGSRSEYRRILTDEDSPIAPFFECWRCSDELSECQIKRFTFLACGIKKLACGIRRFRRKVQNQNRATKLAAEDACRSPEFATAFRRKEIFFWQCFAEKRDGTQYYGWQCAPHVKRVSVAEGVCC